MSSSIKDRLHKILSSLGEGINFEGVDELEARLGALPAEQLDAALDEIAERVRPFLVPGMSVDTISFSFKVVELIPALAKLVPVVDAALEADRCIAKYNLSRHELAAVVNTTRTNLRQSMGRASHLDSVEVNLAKAAITVLNTLASLCDARITDLRAAIIQNLPGVQGLEIPEPPEQLKIPENMEQLFALFPEEPKPTQETAQAGTPPA